jgi:phosphohistidine swiveling domain-containing protein
MKFKAIFDRKGMYIYPFYKADLVATGCIKDIINDKVHSSFSIYEKDYVVIYYEIESALRIGRKIFERIKKDREFFNEVRNQIYFYSQKLEDFISNIPDSETLASVKNIRLSEIYDNYAFFLRQVRKWGWVPVFLDGFEINHLTDFLQSELRDFLRKKDLEHKTSEYYSLLSSSEKMSAVQSEELARLNLLLDLSEDNFNKALRLILNNSILQIKQELSDLFNALNKHIKTYGWLTYAYSGPAMSMKDLLELMKDNIEAGDIKTQKENILAHYSGIKQKKELIKKEINLPEELEYLFDVSSEFMHIKDYRKSVYQKSYLEMDRVLNEIAKRLGIDLRLVKYCTREEINKVLSSNDSKSKLAELSAERSNKCCIIIKNGKAFVYSGAEGEKKINILLKQVADDFKDIKGEITMLRGSVAYNGIVQGPAKIVLNRQDVSKVNIGDILISSATNPDLLIAMKKASAFVTDTGGIISHAAIISRELKKPCIVGTKIATKVFKDGDFVEVDAEKGIIRKIK